jgi:hypothetical protein
VENGVGNVAVRGNVPSSFDCIKFHGKRKKSSKSNVEWIPGIESILIVQKET